jgi:hypothetical protein
MLLNTTCRILLIVFLNCLYSDLSGQVYALEMDSISQKYIGSLSLRQKRKFKKLIAQRTGNNVFKRIDSMAFDYVFIDEIYCFSEDTGKIIERYFYAADSFPFRMYINNSREFVGSFYNLSASDFYYRNYILPYMLQPLISTYSIFQPIQAFQYSKQQIMLTGCVTLPGAKRKFRLKTRNRLESTYRIATMIDKINHKIIISVQFAPKNAQFEIVTYALIWDF